MVRLFKFIVFIMFIVCLGISCSSRGENPIVGEVGISNYIFTPPDQNDTKGHIFYGAWNVNFDLENLTASVTPDRELGIHFNVTPYIPKPIIQIRGYNPSTQVVDVNVTLSNPYPINGFDVRLIIYTDNVGHMLLNADDWTDLYDISGGLPINPFKAYRIEDPVREFPGQTIDTRNLLIKLPGGNANVRFAVDASYPGNCEEPYTMYDFNHGILGPNVGNVATGFITVLDWQDDTNAVYLYCPSVCGSSLVPFNYLGDYIWFGLIVNNLGARPGIYPGFFIATSSNSGSLKLYDKVDIVITPMENHPPICEGIITNPPNGIVPPYGTITMSVIASDPDGNALAYEWDLDWDGNPLNFNVDAVGETIANYRWQDQGFYTVACRITDNGYPPQNTICSRMIIQTGTSNKTIKIDNFDEVDPNLLYQDVLILGTANDRPITHVAYMDKDNSYVYYCNNMNNHNAFGNHMVISEGPINGSNYGVKIVGAGNIIYVFWLEYETIDYPAQCKIKMRKSYDFGQSFNPPVVVASVNDPYLIIDMDVCMLFAPNQMGLFYVFKTPLNEHFCYLLISMNEGDNWNAPPHGSGQFRDFGLFAVENPQIKFSNSSGVIHVFWKDYRVDPAHYYYDFSSDFGDSWHMDFQVSDSPQPAMASFAVSSNGNGYFVWTDNLQGAAYLRKSLYSDPPVFNTSESIIYLGPSNYYGIDIWVSNSGKTVVVPMTYQYSYVKNRYYYSYDGGTNWSGYFERSFTDKIPYGIRSDAATSVDPDRIEIVNTWVETNEILTPPDGHIYGDFVYLAEM